MIDTLPHTYAQKRLQSDMDGESEKVRSVKGELRQEVKMIIRKVYDISRRFVIYHLKQLQNLHEYTCLIR